MKARNKRLILIITALLLLSAAVALVLSAMKENVVFYHTPSEVLAGKAPQGRPFRIGGRVAPDSLRREADGVTVFFAITDTANDIKVTYQGTLPDLFQEGKGTVIQGTLGADGLFHATEVLAKHDENYMPPEAQHAIDQAHDAARTLQ